MAKLVVALSGEPPRVFALGDRPITIGREPENDVQIDLPDVSRRHSRIEALPQGGFRVVDLGSKNGTFLNGRTVQAMALEFDDRLRIGEATILFVDDATDPNEAVRGLGEGGFPWSAGPSKPSSAAMPLLPREEAPSSDEHGTWRSRRDKTGPHTRRSNRSYLKERMLRLGLLSQNIASEHDLTRLVDTILDEVIDFTGFERGLLLLADDDDSGRLKCVRGRHLEHEHLEDLERRFSRGLVEEALEQKKITFRTGIAQDSSFSARESVVSMGLESALCIPLPMTPMRTVHDGKEDRRRSRRRERILGVIYLDSTSAIRDLDDADLKLLEMVAAQAAIALQNARLHHQATTDPLTGLANRGFINQVFEEELRRVKDERELLAVLLLDIDHFKRINDTLGHDTGDEVLRRVAGRIRRTIRRDDYAGRWGGEEFIVVLPGEGVQGAVTVAGKIADAIKSRPISEAEVTVTVSIGVAVFPDHGATSGELVKHADQALYAAKSAGRDRTTVFRQDLDRANHRTDPFGGLFDSDTARTHRNLGAVFDTIDVLRSSRPPKEILARALDNVCDLTRARRAMLIVEDAPGGPLKVVASRVRGGGKGPEADEFSHSSVRTAMRESRSLCVLDSTDEQARILTSSSIDKLGLSTVMCVPLLVGDRALGVLYADDSTSHREFTQADLAHLEVLANQLALSLMANPRLQALVSGIRPDLDETRNLKDEVARLRAEVERLRAKGGG
ncbi:MAG: diguanylate cyclase [Planctomycetes bacterium]|nr:diguanylate cyclase [Planctomycetota bacterium]